MGNARGNTDEFGSDPSEGKSHPVGKAVGGAAGAVAGAIAGAPGGPIVAGASAAIGAIAGWLEGKTIAEGINPDEEMKYWENNYRNEPGYSADKKWDDYRPAYLSGIYSYDPDEDSFDEHEEDIRQHWNSIKGSSRLTADEATRASRAAWKRVSRPRTT